METKYQNVNDKLLGEIINDFYNYVMEEHDCILREELVDLFIHKDCTHPKDLQYKDGVGQVFCGICHAYLP